MKLSQQIHKKRLTPYQLIGRKYCVNAHFVGMIAQGHRIPKRGKGLQILNELTMVSKLDSSKQNKYYDKLQQQA